eukprot:scaffold91518_cov33-Attheya_sp.AAC.3
MAVPWLYQSMPSQVSRSHLYFCVRYSRASWDEYARRMYDLYDLFTASLLMYKVHCDKGYSVCVPLSMRIFAMNLSQGAPLEHSIVTHRACSALQHERFIQLLVSW